MVPLRAVQALLLYTLISLRSALAIVGLDILYTILQENHIISASLRTTWDHVTTLTGKVAHHGPINTTYTKPKSGLPGRQFSKVLTLDEITVSWRPLANADYLV